MKTQASLGAVATVCARGATRVSFGASCSNAGCELFAGRHLEVGAQALRAVPKVFVFLTFYFCGATGHARLPRFSRRGALQRLEAGLFLRAHDVHALCVQRRSLLLKLAHRLDLRAKRFRVLGGSVAPGLNPRRLSVGLILKNARPLTGRGAPRFCV